MFLPLLGRKCPSRIVVGAKSALSLMHMRSKCICVLRNMAEYPEASRVDKSTESKMIRESSTSSSETISPNSSSPSSTENDVPSSTCDWTRSLIDKLGIRYECKSPIDIVTEHMSALAYNLFPQEINDLEELADILGSLNNLNHDSLPQINFKGLNFFTPVEEKLRDNVAFKEIDM